MDMYTLLYLKWITNKDHCTVQGTLLDVMGQPGWEESFGENGYMYIYIAESFHCSPETITTLLIGYTSIKNKKLKKK